MIISVPEEMTVGQKLKSLREDLKRADKQWTLDFVAKKIGVTKGAVSQYENDENKPSSEILLSIAKLYNVKVEELIDPNEPAWKGKQTNSHLVQEENKSYGSSPMIKGERAKLYLSKLPEKEAELYIPYYDVEITAGRIELYFDDIDEIPEGYIYAPQYRNCIACHVKGNSMYDRIFPGSRLFVYHLSNRKYIDFGQIYLIVLEGYRLLKYIHPHPTDETKVRLVSHNKAEYPDWDVEKVDILNLFLVKGYENQNAI